MRGFAKQCNRERSICICLGRFRYHLLLISILITLPGCALGLSASVTVVTTERSGNQDFGSGVVISDSGDVLTCYHVVEGAVAVRVVYLKHFYDARVISIAPDRDIAKLHMIGAPLPTQYVTPSTSLPSNVLGRSLYIYGFAAGMFDQRITAQPTQDHFALSEQMKGVRGERLFAESGVKLLPLSTTIYRGMSGAPVLLGETVIGIISGSLNQGGSIAWAIGLENASSQYMIDVDAPRAGFKWPPLSLMAGGWENLRRRSGVGEDVVLQIEKLQEALTTLKPQVQATCAPTVSAVQGLVRLQELLGNGTIDTMLMSDYSSRRGSNAWDDVQTTLNNTAEAFTLADSEVDGAAADYKSAANQFHLLMSSVQGYLRNLPDTPRNRGLRETFHDQLSSFITAQTDIQRKMIEADEIPNGNSANWHTVGEYRRQYERWQRKWSGFEQVYCSLIPAQSSTLRSASRDVQLLLSADQIDAQ